MPVQTSRESDFCPVDNDSHHSTCTLYGLCLHGQHVRTPGRHSYTQEAEVTWPSTANAVSGACGQKSATIHHAKGHLSAGVLDLRQQHCDLSKSPASEGQAGDTDFLQIHCEALKTSPHRSGERAVLVHGYVYFLLLVSFSRVKKKGRFFWRNHHKMYCCLLVEVKKK